MRITKINLNNFRAFYAAHEIDLGTAFCLTM
jgi:hypothetical protein